MPDDAPPDDAPPVDDEPPIEVLPDEPEPEVPELPDEPIDPVEPEEPVDEPVEPVDDPVDDPLTPGFALSAALLPVGWLKPPLLPLMPPTSLLLFVVEPEELPRFGDTVDDPLCVPLVEPPLLLLPLAPLVSSGWPTYVLLGVPVPLELEPVEPLAPLEPVEPLEPLVPLVPLEPMEPLEPLEPIDPVEPEVPDPDELDPPIDPDEPVEPVEPAPVDPAPVDPLLLPKDPDEPEDPVEDDPLGSPYAPEDDELPGDDEPDEPDVPDDPDEPDVLGLNVPGDVVLAEPGFVWLLLSEEPSGAFWSRARVLELLLPLSLTFGRP